MGSRGKPPASPREAAGRSHARAQTAERVRSTWISAGRSAEERRRPEQRALSDTLRAPPTRCLNAFVNLNSCKTLLSNPERPAFPTPRPPPPVPGWLAHDSPSCPRDRAEARARRRILPPGLSRRARPRPRPLAAPREPCSGRGWSFPVAPAGDARDLGPGCCSGALRSAGSRARWAVQRPRGGPRGWAPGAAGLWVFPAPCMFRASRPSCGDWDFVGLYVKRVYLFLFYFDFILFFLDISGYFL